MSNPILLTGIGYWHSIHYPQYPDPGHFVDEQWNAEEKERVIAYLKSGHEMPYAYAGVSWCRFRCGYHQLGSLELTDGKYLWPEGLYHYIEAHNVKLPQAIIDHILNNTEIKPAGDNYTIDWSWWKAQQGSNTVNNTFNDLQDIGVLTIIQVSDLEKAKQEHILRQYLLDAYGVRGRLKAVDQILTGQETSITGRYTNISDFLLQLPAIGLRGTFRYFTREEYDRLQESQS
jgi:hypothetical protein